MRIDILGVKIDDLTMNEVLEKIGQFLKSNNQHYIVLPYSEFIVRARKEEGFRKILNEADLCLCESRGLYLAMRLMGKAIKEEINGINLIYNICSKFPNKSFLLGGKSDVIQKAKEKLGKKIVGAEHGYQDLDKVINKINKVKSDILLVGLGSPKQEKWIYENLEKMPSVKLAIGVGGAFDFISGRIRRAPKFLQKISLEWLWRLIRQPWRMVRIWRGVFGLSYLTLKQLIHTYFVKH